MNWHEQPNPQRIAQGWIAAVDQDPVQRWQIRRHIASPGWLNKTRAEMVAALRTQSLPADLIALGELTDATDQEKLYFAATNWLRGLVDEAPDLSALPVVAELNTAHAIALGRNEAATAAALVVIDDQDRLNIWHRHVGESPQRHAGTRQTGAQVVEFLPGSEGGWQWLLSK